MTQEQLKEAVSLHEKICSLRKTLEELGSNCNCRLSFIYDIKDGNGTPHPHILPERYLWPIEKILKDHTLYIKQDIHTQIDMLTKKIERL